MDQPCESRCNGPQEVADGEHPADVEAVHQPPGHGLHCGIGPEERRQQYSHPVRRKRKFRAQLRRGHREIGPVHIIDPDRDNQQNQDAPLRRGDLLDRAPQSDHLSIHAMDSTIVIRRTSGTKRAATGSALLNVRRRALRCPASSYRRLSSVDSGITGATGTRFPSASMATKVR